MQQRHIFQVSELNRDVRQLLESGFALVWLQGELSNFTAHGSGHWYFSLKDAKAQISAAMFNMKNRLVNFQPRSGMEVVVRARVTLYEPQGRFQIVVEHMEEAGSGALQRLFEELKAKLQAEGLFATERKRPLPAMPQQIGVITSPTGAAIRDILTTLQRRCASLPVMIYPVLVQGDQAAAQIARTIALANQRNECDVLILARGGGSIEDLWPFNDERVARAIAASDIPLVCGVGHEVDFTIADFVADYRAATPTAAAEICSPDQTFLQKRLDQQQQALQRLLQHHLQRAGERLAHVRARLQSPARRVQDQQQRLDELQQRLSRATLARLRHDQHRLGQSRAQLLQHAPAQTLATLTLRNQQLQQQLSRAMSKVVTGHRQTLAQLIRTLNAVSPLATLERGYAISFLADGKTVVTDASQLQPGDLMQTRLAQGRITSQVVECNDE
ncbi:MAG: exodeoxyribonuclease VII large subunit [Gammaproteobacteria bacterium]|nr:exodeoxyribonuclease VII large subunit [Gammaproteobacteria bacterium]